MRNHPLHHSLFGITCMLANYNTELNLDRIDKNRTWPGVSADVIINTARQRFIISLSFRLIIINELGRQITDSRSTKIR